MSRVFEGTPVRSGRYVDVNLDNVQPNTPHYLAWNSYNGLPDNCNIIVPFSKDICISFRAANRSFIEIDPTNSTSIDFQIRVASGIEKVKRSELSFSYIEKREGVANKIATATVPIIIRSSKCPVTSLQGAFSSVSSSKRKHESDNDSHEDEAPKKIRPDSYDSDTSDVSDTQGSPIDLVPHFAQKFTFPTSDSEAEELAQPSPTHSSFENEAGMFSNFSYLPDMGSFDPLSLGESQDHCTFPDSVLNL